MYCIWILRTTRPGDGLGRGFAFARPLSHAQALRAIQRLTGLEAHLIHSLQPGLW